MIELKILIHYGEVEMLEAFAHKKVKPFIMTDWEKEIQELFSHICHQIEEQTNNKIYPHQKEKGNFN